MHNMASKILEEGKRERQDHDSVKKVFWCHRVFVVIETIKCTVLL